MTEQLTENSIKPIAWIFCRKFVTYIELDLAEQSPSYPMIGFKPARKHILYFYDIHPNIENINLESIEHHCKYSDPERHKAEIISRLTKTKI